MDHSIFKLVNELSLTASKEVCEIAKYVLLFLFLKNKGTDSCDLKESEPGVSTLPLTFSEKNLP